jgi:hypothetical protein
MRHGVRHVIALLGWIGAMIGALPDVARAETAAGLVAPGFLLIFDTAAPDVPTIRTISGLVGASGETVVGIDVRPATGRLYAVSVDAAGVTRTYLVDTGTGAFTFVGQFMTPALSNGSLYGFDFNPRADRLRCLDSTAQNLRINPDVGTVASTDTNLTFTAPATGPVVAVAYDRNTAGGVSQQTTLYGIDRGSNRLVTVGGIDGTPSPNSGVVTNVGGLGVVLDASSDAGLDVSPTGTAFASLRVGGTTGLYTIALTTGAATLVGTFPLDVKDLAVLPSAATTTTSTTLPPTCAASCGTTDPCTLETCVAGTCVGEPLTGFASATCACERSSPAACAGATLPTKIQRLAAQPCSLLTRAGNATGGRRKTLLGKTARRWTAVARLVAGRAGRGLTPECRGALADAYRDAAARVRQLRSGSSPGRR